MTVTVSASETGGAIRAPASKSSMQRAVACALLADGVSTLRNPSLCDDSRAALGLARGFGASVEISPDRVDIRGSPRFGSSSSGAGRAGAGKPEILSCGESGLCMRMFSPIAALLPGERLLEAKGSLAARPMTMVSGPLEALGASAVAERGFPPLRIKGPIRGGEIEVDAGLSSQLLTGLLIALPLAPGDSLIHVRNAVSRGYLDLSLDTMRAFGILASRSGDFAEFRISGGRRYTACDFTVEGDWSGAAFLLVAGATTSDGLRIGGLQRESSQPDRAILGVLESAGARVGYPGGDEILVSGGRLEAFRFDATDCPDLFPPLVALAAACEGVSRIEGAGRLKAKESDRALALIEEFGAMGIGVRREEGCLLVEGGSCKGGVVDARGDHRIAMAAAVAALRAREPVTVNGAECVAKSWPEFFSDLDSIRR